MNDIKSSRGSEVEVKNKLLQFYFNKFFNEILISNYENDVYLFNLFSAGSNQENIEISSSIVFLQCIKKMHTEMVKTSRKFLKVNSFFNDADISEIIKLSQVIYKNEYHSLELGKISFVCKNYRHALNETIEQIKKSGNIKAFVFIDPFDYKDVRMNDIKNLISNNSVEVLLYLPCKNMFTINENGIREPIYQFINEIIPTEQWPLKEPSVNFINILSEAFKTAIGTDYLLERFVNRIGKDQYCCFFSFKHLEINV